MKNNINFDDYVDNYTNLVHGQSKFFNKDRDYFSTYKVNILKNILSVSPNKILDFGCGIGLNIHALQEKFQNSQISATDISDKSLSYIKNNFDNIEIIYNKNLDSHKFDLIFIAGVIHHIPSANRDSTFLRLRNLLTDNGKIIIFEHNPYNPITRRMVSTCEFDADAELITKGMLINQLNHCGFNVLNSGFCLFFPQILSKFRPFEKYMTKLFLGGQFFVFISIK